MCFMEAWLHRDIPYYNVSISGFQTVWVDRDQTESSKRKGGDLLFLSTTTGVILVTLTSKNRSVALMLNRWLLGSGHIIRPGSFHTPLL